MTELFMPHLILNMGGEMIYILQQRLIAQNVTADKQCRVLVDVLNTMYSTQFINELFHSSNTHYTIASIQQIFHKLVHSSIMRLNSNSMNKLYDLICMNMKYQFIQSGHSSLYQYCITNNHIQYMKQIVNTTATKSTLSLIDQCEMQLLQLQSALTVYDWCILRYKLLLFYQDSKVKISLFLADKIQNLDGNIIVTPNTGEVGLGYNSSIPVGTVTYHKSTKLNDTVFNVNNRSDRTNIQYDYTELGTNLYAKDNRKHDERTPTCTSKITNVTTEINPNNIIKSQSANIGANDTSSSANKPLSNNDDVSSSGRYDSSKQELNKLASLLGSTMNHVNVNDSELIRNLFNDDDNDDSNADEYIIDVNQPYQIITTKTPTNHVNDKFKHFSLNDGSTNTATNDDDLLSMMDSVS